MDNKGSCDFYPYRSFSNRNFFLFTLIFVNNPFLLKLELMFFVCCTHLNKVKKVSVIIRDSVWVPLIFFLELHLLYRLILWMFGMLLPQDSVSSQVFFLIHIHQFHSSLASPYEFKALNNRWQQWSKTNLLWYSTKLGAYWLIFGCTIGATWH